MEKPEEGFGPRFRFPMGASLPMCRTEGELIRWFDIDSLNGETKLDVNIHHTF